MKTLTAFIAKKPLTGLLVAAAEAAGGVMLMSDQIHAFGGIVLVALAIPTAVLTLLIKYKTYKQLKDK